jgi:hypothetical protein
VLKRQRPRERALHGGLVIDDQYACLFGHDRKRPRARTSAFAGVRRRGGRLQEASVTATARMWISKS